MKAAEGRSVRKVDPDATIRSGIVRRINPVAAHKRISAGSADQEIVAGSAA